MDGIYVYGATSTGTATGCTVYSNASSGIHLNGDGGSMSGWTVSKNTIYSNGGSGVDFDGANSSNVFNCVIYGNTGDGVLLRGDSGASGSSNNCVYNNTILASSATGWAARISAATVGTNPANDELKNNVLHSSGTSPGCVCVYASSGTGLACDYNAEAGSFSADSGATAVSLSTWQSYGCDANSITSDTATFFANAAGNDYHLKIGSPAMNVGTTLTAVTDDRDGVARQQNPAYDIGAYEFPALYQSVVSEGESSTTATTWQTKATITLSPPATDDWLILAFAEYRSSSASYATSVRVTLDGSTADDVIAQASSKPKDATDCATFMAFDVETLTVRRRSRPTRSPLNTRRRPAAPRISARPV